MSTNNVQVVRKKGSGRVDALMTGRGAETVGGLRPGGARIGDVAGASAAGKAGTIFTLSSMSGHSIEEVAAAGSGPKWFQLYFLGGRKGSEQLIDRAQRAGYSALVVTMDTQIPGNRERDYGN